MRLVSGTTLGHYEIVSSLGAGGMGEVYRARDTRLGREVAIKILLAQLAQDADRLARFEREARVLASLSHPNVAVLHGFEREVPSAGDRADGETATIAFLVMELVEGETLADRIARGPLPWREAVAVLDQIADGLKAAHERGIVHRDLKPANVKIDRDGRVKVLDFGLARAATVDRGDSGMAATQSPTLTAATGVGVLLGTAAYMSPEQARGLTVDRRADVWAFGVCLYEAIVGRRPFEGKDISLTLAAVLSKDVAWNLLPETTPRAIRDLLGRCLEKDPNRRIQDLGDAQWWLRRAEEPATASVGEGEPGGEGRTSRLRRWALAAVALVAGVAIGVFAGRAAGPATDPVAAAPTLRLSAMTAVAPKPTRAGREIAVAPSGTAFAYGGSGTAGNGIYIHDLERAQTRFVSGTEGGSMPFFSRDGRQLGFERDDSLYRVPAEGGLPQLLCTLQGSARATVVGVSWGADSLVYAVAGTGIWRVPATGGTAQKLPLADEAAVTAVFPELLPDGAHLLYNDLVTDEIRALRLDTGEIVDLGATVKGEGAQYVDSGHLVFAVEGSLWFVPFDADRVKVSGPARSLQQATRTGRFQAPFAVSRGGTLVTIDSGAVRLVAIAADGLRRDLGAEPGLVRHPRRSPDGRSVAYTRGGVGAAQVWIREVESGREVRLSEKNDNTVFPVWTHDGRIVYYHPTVAKVSTIEMVPADRSTEPVVLFESERLVVPAGVTADGELLFSQGTDIWRLDLAVPGEAQPWLATEALERNPDISPDGEWVAYETDESGRFEVYLRPLHGTVGGQPVSTSGGEQPAWSHDGRTLYYRSPRGLEAVDFDGRASPPRLGAPRFVMEMEGGDFSGQRSYDPTDDGGFIAAEPESYGSTFPIIYNLGAEMRGLGS